jgi:hypothetical protein
MWNEGGTNVKKVYEHESLSACDNTENQKSLTSKTNAKHLKILNSQNPHLFADFHGGSEPIITEEFIIIYRSPRIPQLFCPSMPPLYLPQSDSAYHLADGRGEAC